MASQFNWKVSFTVHNVRLASGSISAEGMEIDLHPKSDKDLPRVRVSYRFGTPASSPTIGQQAKETIERFLACGDVEWALLGWDVRTVVEDFDLELENWRELSAQGKNPPPKFSATFRNTATWNKDSVSRAWDWSKKVACHADEEPIFRILRLLRHSMVEEDEYDRFSKVWRAFNAFYNHLAGGPRSSERSRIDNFGKSLIATNSKWLTSAIQGYWTPKSSIEHYLDFVIANRGWNSVMDCLIKQGFADNQGVNHSETLAAAVSTQQIARALESALLCLYCERNRVMHGETISDSERDLLYVCALFLQRIVAIALNEFYFIPIKESA